MSKLGCTCGHVIRDQTDSLPYKGQVLKDQDREAFFGGVADALGEYLAAVRRFIPVVPEEPSAGRVLASEGQVRGVR